MADFVDGNRAFYAFKDKLRTDVQNGKSPIEDQVKKDPIFWIEVSKGMSGYFAVMVWDGAGFPEPWETGYGRYEEIGPAIAEAKQWALEEGIEFKHYAK